MKKSQLMLKIQNGIKVFENPIFGQIRMVMVDDEPWVCWKGYMRSIWRYELQKKPFKY